MKLSMKSRVLGLVAVFALGAIVGTGVIAKASLRPKYRWSDSCAALARQRCRARHPPPAMRR